LLTTLLATILKGAQDFQPSARGLLTDLHWSPSLRISKLPPARDTHLTVAC